jgi:hypothetical protein
VLPPPNGTVVQTIDDGGLVHRFRDATGKWTLHPQSIRHYRVEVCYLLDTISQTMPTRSQRVMLLRQGRPSGFEAEWNPPNPSQCYPQARSIYLALANFNALAYAVYAEVPLSTMNQLKGLPQYQMFVDLLNYFYCGVKHFFDSNNDEGMTQSLRQRLKTEHNILCFHIRQMTHTQRFPFRETGAALHGKIFSSAISG